jgi:hypothetical protein
MSAGRLANRRSSLSHPRRAHQSHPRHAEPVSVNSVTPLILLPCGEHELEPGLLLRSPCEPLSGQSPRIAVQG